MMKLSKRQGRALFALIVAGAAHIGLDMATFPFEVPAFKLQFKAKPKR